jgi:hypothetical protein
MSRLSNPGCMLRAVSALFGTIFLPVGISFFFVLHRQHWPQGVAAVLASFGFYYVAWRADSILGMEDIVDTSGVALPRRPPPGDDAGHAPPPNQEPDA